MTKNILNVVVYESRNKVKVVVFSIDRTKNAFLIVQSASSGTLRRLKQAHNPARGALLVQQRKVFAHYER